MATDTRTLPAFFNSNADFQAYCQGIAAQLVVAGMVKTTDTGQINNATVTKPAGINTPQGYEIYRFSDAAQGSQPLFFKIEYGSSGAVDRPALWITSGTGSDGAGTITGGWMARTVFGPSASKVSGTTLTSYCSGDGGYFVLVTNCDFNSNTFPFCLMLDRIRDATGATTSEGFAFYAANPANSVTSIQCWSLIGNTATSNSTTALFAGLTPTNINVAVGNGLRVYNNNIMLMPIIIGAGQIRFVKAGVFYSSNDLGSVGGLTFTANNLGGSHTYLTTAGLAGSWTQTGVSEKLAILWE